MAPGTVAGVYEKDNYYFHNFNYQEILSDLTMFWTKLRAINPKAKMLLTVSPVPLTATASGNQVLTAHTYSKSTLRAVAGDIASENKDIYYFPSYELISSPAKRGMFYNPDLRTVNEHGVSFVMDHFIEAINQQYNEKASTQAGTSLDNPLVCDEEKLEEFAN